MKNYLSSYITEKEIPKLNPLLAEGIVVSHMKEILPYMDRIIRCVALDFIDGLEYLGMERCTPKEQMYFAPTKKKSKRLIDMSTSNVIMVRLRLAWQKEEFSRYLYLPFCEEAGKITISGANFIIHAVLDDKAITEGDNFIFVRLTRSRNVYYRRMHQIYKDGDLISTQVITGQLHNAKRDKKGSTYRELSKTFSTIPHYLFGKFGVVETFKKFAVAEVQVVNEIDLTEEKFPTKDWIYCECAMSKHHAYGALEGTRPAIVVKRGQWSTLVEGLVSGFFYVYEIFPKRIVAEYINSLDSEINLWRILLGHIIYTNDAGEGKILSDINDHYFSLDSYIDEVAKEELSTTGVEVNDHYELFAHLIESFSARIANSGDTLASMYGKRLNVLRYVCDVIIQRLFKTMFDIRKLARKPRLTKESINMVFNRRLKPELIFTINSGHPEVTAVSTGSDNKAFNITNALILQSQTSTRMIGGGKSASKDSSLQLHMSIAEMGSLVHLPKSEPTGRGRLNLMANVSPKGELIPDPKKRDFINSIQEMIKS